MIDKVLLRKSTCFSPAFLTCSVLGVQRDRIHCEYTLDNYCYDLKCVIEEIFSQEGIDTEGNAEIAL